MGRKDKKDKSKKAKDKVNGGKVNPPEDIYAEIHVEQADSEVETQAEEEADEDVDEDLPSTKRRKKTPKLNLAEEQEDDLLNISASI